MHVQIVAFQRAVSKFGIVELVRTGRVALKRGEDVFDYGMWGGFGPQHGGSQLAAGGEAAAAGEGDEGTPPALQSVHDVYAGDAGGAQGAKG